jgi:hypothetical protein
MRDNLVQALRDTAPSWQITHTGDECNPAALSITFHQADWIRADSRLHDVANLFELRERALSLPDTSKDIEINGIALDRKSKI